MDVLETGEIVLIDLEPNQLLEIFIVYDGPYTEFDYRVNKKKKKKRYTQVVFRLISLLKGKNNHYLRDKWDVTKIHII